MQLDIPYQLENFIDGQFVAPLSEAFIDNFNPASGSVSGKIPNSNEKDIEAAVVAAKKAFQIWSNTSTEKRFAILNRIAELIDENITMFDAMKNKMVSFNEVKEKFSVEPSKVLEVW